MLVCLCTIPSNCACNFDYDISTISAAYSFKVKGTLSHTDKGQWFCTKILVAVVETAEYIPYT